jgi:transketolase
MVNSIDLVKEVKTACLQLAHNANASHLGGAFSIADVLSVLYSDILAFNCLDPTWPERDRVFYSKGHASTAYYATLKQVGFFDEEALHSFSKNGSFFTTHVNHKVPGVELSTGSLGHALSVACGVALAGKRKNAGWQVYAILSDGELNEGSNWEAILFAPHHKLNNLTLIIDYNGIQSLGSVAEVLELKPLKQKFESFGWHVIEIDGHNHTEIQHCLRKENSLKIERPKVIIAHTVKGNGIDFMEHNLAWHYKSPDKEQLKIALAQIEGTE